MNKLVKHIKNIDDSCAREIDPISIDIDYQRFYHEVMSAVLYAEMENDSDE